MRPSGRWAEKGKPAIVTTLSTRAVSHTILSAISLKFVVSIMEFRNSQEECTVDGTSQFDLSNLNAYTEEPFVSYLSWFW